MRIQIASDLHLEMHRGNYPSAEYFWPVADRDVLVLAGDIGTHTNALRFIEDEARISPVILIPGNHEYYSRHSRDETDFAWRQIAGSISGLHYLVAEGVAIDGMRFWGAPWYSDFRGRRDEGFLYWVRNSLNDFSPRFNDSGAWTVAKHLEEHARQTELLRAQAGQVDVVITHWPPTRHATAPRFKGDALNGYFVNDREDLVEEIGAHCWISGHVHDAYEAAVGQTWLVGNPAGYPNEAVESPLFRPDRVIEVSQSKPQPQAAA